MPPHPRGLLNSGMKEVTASLPVPLYVIAVDPDEIRRRGDEIGTALREGQVVDGRAA